MEKKMEEIYQCCKFIMERISKEIDKINSNFFSESVLNQGNNQELLLFQFMKILLKEADPILKEEYLYIINRVIQAFKDLREFQKVQFNLESKNEIKYTKFYKEIFNIINYITNIFPLEEYKYNLTTIYPSYVSYKRLQQLLPTESTNNIMRENEIPIQPKEIIEMFRCFLLLFLSRTFYFIYYNISEFIEVFLGNEFRHDKYIGLIAQQKLDLLYDLVHKPNISNIFTNSWFENHFQDTDRYKNSHNIKDILNFGLFLKEINDNFIEFNESYNIKYCLLYFFLLFNYEDFHFLDNSSNKTNYPIFLLFFMNEILMEELFNEEAPKKLTQLVTYKLLNFVHGKNYCSIFPTIYFEKFLVDLLIKNVSSDKNMNYPKYPFNYYSKRLKRYNNLKIIVESFVVNFDDKDKLLALIKEKIKIFISHLQVK